MNRLLQRRAPTCTLGVMNDRRQPKLCSGIVLLSRSDTGGCGKLGPPRRCNRLAVRGDRDDLCEVHGGGQREVQLLYGSLLVYGWEARARVWAEERARRAEARRPGLP